MNIQYDLVVFKYPPAPATPGSQHSIKGVIAQPVSLLGTLTLGRYNRAVTHAATLKQRVLLAFAALALLLRVAVPVGFMPASLAGGWPIEVCPDGLPTDVMVALYGEHHAHHGDGGDTPFYECDYGGGTTGAFLTDCTDYSLGLNPAATPRLSLETLPVARTPVFGFLSRAPPSVVRLFSSHT